MMSKFEETFLQGYLIVEIDKKKKPMKILIKKYSANI